ncbi:MAG: LytR C-terminal domain-containing protein [Actinomycetaceae bacterium]|nr:LytR C-terminal domain-containing protein [Actinomycetaceae bacterium]
MSRDQYQEDEFDVAGDRLPKGAHREQQPWWQGILPFVVVLVVAPLLAWAIFLLIGHDRGTPPETAPSSTETTVNETPSENTGEKTEEPVETEAPATQEPTQAPDNTEGAGPDEATPSGSVNTGAKVAVLNASGITGLAAEVANKVKSGGFTQVEASNFQGTKPGVNTIYFAPGFKDTAMKIQQVTQIDMVKEQTGLGSDISVVLIKRVS